MSAARRSRRAARLGETLAHLPRESVRDLGKALLLDLFYQHAALAGSPSQNALGIVGGHVQAELPPLALLAARQRLRESRQEDGRALAQAELGVLLSEDLAAVDADLHLGPHHVARLHRPLHRFQQRVAVAQLFNLLVHPLLAHRGRLTLYSHRTVVAQVDAGPHGHGSLEDERLLLCHLDGWQVDGLDLLLGYGLAVGFGDENVQGLVADRLAAQIALQHRPRGLPLAEAGHFRPLGKATISLLQGLLHALGFDFDL
jgi:hypothetical protein